MSRQAPSSCSLKTCPAWPGGSQTRPLRLPAGSVLGSAALTFRGARSAFGEDAHRSRQLGGVLLSLSEFLVESLTLSVAQAHPKPRGAFGFERQVFPPISALYKSCHSLCFCPAESLGVGWQWVCDLNQAVALPGTFCPFSLALPKCP